jgi:hypothetical protein
MIPYDFDYERPATLQEAAALLRRSGTSARLLAGGTDLIPNMRVQLLKPALLISLGAIAPVPPQTGWKAGEDYRRIDIAQQPQAEAVAYAPNGAILYDSEARDGGAIPLYRQRCEAAS